jgi:hypothetical protein
MEAVGSFWFLVDTLCQTSEERIILSCYGVIVKSQVRVNVL